MSVTQSMHDLASGYVKMRNLKKDLTAKHKEELAPINTNMKKLEAAMLDKMNR